MYLKKIGVLDADGKKYRYVTKADFHQMDHQDGYKKFILFV